MKNIEIEKFDSDIVIVNAILRALYNGDRADLAERLLQRFGSFHAIFRAAPEDLLKVEGMSETSAAFFSAVVPQFRQALRRAVKQIKPISEYDLVGLAIAMDGEADRFRANVYIDSADRIIKWEKTVGVDSVKKTIGTACGLNAAKLATVEYGTREKSKTPETAALKYLSELIRPLEAVGIEFVEHIELIGSGYKFGSLRRALNGEKGYIELQNASKEKYKKLSNLDERIEEYLKARNETVRLSFK